MKRGGADNATDASLQQHTTHIYNTLWEGEYDHNAGRRVLVKGDASKVSQIVCSTAGEKEGIGEQL